MKYVRKLNMRHLLLLSVLVLTFSFCGGLYLSATAYDERSAIVSSDGDPVSVRKGPGTSYAKVATLQHGATVTIIGEDMASDGSKWYQIRFTLEESTDIGYVHSSYLIYDSYIGIPEDALPSFEVLLEEFPESYKESLLRLYDMYPNWKFVAVDTELDWNTVLAEESSRGRSLVWSSSISSWKSLEDGAYDWNNSAWIAMDGPNWVTASEEIVAHYLDPRNYLNGSMIFAFAAHAYDQEAQTIDGVKAIMSGTFMAQDFTEGETTYSYADVLMEAAQKYGVSPYVLAAMIRIEIGTTGINASITGTEVGYESLYNYYNVGAYAVPGMTPNQRGLWWAAGAGTGEKTYGRPWDSRYKALLGGAEYYATNYVARGQNTLYLKKFNVTSNNTYNHQYMTNIQGAASEAHAYSRAYNAEAKQQNLVFYIPVYDNMPETACEKPTKYGSPNNKLDSITVDGVAIKDFDMDTDTYVVEIDALATSVALEAVAKDSTAVITGTGMVDVALGEQTYTILCTAENGDERTYTVTLVQKEDAELKELSVSAGTLTPEFNGDILDYKVIILEDQADIFVTAVPRNELATFEVQGDGEGLVEGNEITIEVIAKDGETTKIYRLTVEKYREPETEPDDTGSSDSTESGGDTDPDNSTESGGDTDPDNSTESGGDTDPDDSTESGGDTDPDDSTESGGDTDPDDSTESGGDTDPDDSTESEGDTDPDDSTESDESTESETKTTMYVLSDVYVRSGAGTAHGIIGTLFEGQQVVVLGEFSPDRWAKIEYNGGIGYCYGEYLGERKPVETEPPTETDPPTEEKKEVIIDADYTLGENHHITGITGYPMTKDGFLAGLNISNGTVEIYKADGVTALGNSDVVGTGALVKIYDLDGKLYDTYTVLIYGDVNGDGKVGTMDLMMVRQCLKKKMELSDINYRAGDVNKDGTISTMDLMMIRQHLKSRLELEQ